MNQTINFLSKLLSIPSPTGNTAEAIDFIKTEFNSLGLESTLNKKGALIATIRGENDSEQITFSAHVDTLGAMVKEIKSNGRLKLSLIGGYAPNSIEGEEVIIQAFDGSEYTGTILYENPSVHVSGDEVYEKERTTDNLEIRLDERVSDEESISKLGIEVGNYISFKPSVQISDSGFIKSRHLDDKAGIAAIYNMAKELLNRNVKPKNTVNFFISNYEEVGHGSSASIPENTSVFIAIDMAAVGEGQKSDEFSTTICMKDSSGPYDYETSKKLIDSAKTHDINYKTDIYPHYGSDVSAALRAGYDFKFALIGPGVDASHSTERTHIDAIENTVKLGLAYIDNYEV